MKKSKFAILTIALLSLVGCTRNDPTPSKDSSSSFSSSSESTSSEKSSPLSSPKQDSSFSSSQEESSSSESSQNSESLWGSKNAALIKKYLNDTIIPYFDMKGNLDISYAIKNDDFGKLTILGDAKWVDGVTLKTYKESINACEGWDVKEERGNYIIAENPSSKVEAKLFKDNDDFINIECTYDEVYDKTASSSWDEETLKEMKQDFNESVPYVYLGTKYPQVSYSDADKCMNIVGKKWNDAFLDDAKESLKKEGYEVINENTDTLTMSGPTSDKKNSFSITLSRYGTSQAEKTSMKVTFVEGYDPEVTTDWSDEVKNQILDHLDGHEIPFVYLGKSNPSALWDTYQGCSLTLTGGDFKDEILSRAEKAFSASKGWTSSKTSTTFTSSIREDDGCRFDVSLQKTSAGLTQMKIAYTPGYKAPTLDKAKWKDDLLTEFSTDFGADHVSDIPYIYLNTDKEKLIYDEGSKTLTITGGIYAPDMMDVVKNNFDSIKKPDGSNLWSTKKTDGFGYFSYDTLTMNALMSDGCNFALTLTTNSMRDTILKIQFEHYYDPKGTSWDEKTQGMMKAHLLGNTIPFFYMNSDAPSSVWSETSQQLTLTGGTYQEAMMKEAEKKFKEAGYDTDLSERYTYPLLTAEKQLAGCYVSIEFTTDSRKGTSLVISVDEDFDQGEISSWNSDTQKLIEENFASEDVPYVYLGTKNETSSYLKESKRLSIYGNSFNSRILSIAKSAFENAGYTCQAEGTVLAGYKKRADGKYLLLDLEKQSRGFPVLYISLEDEVEVKSGSYSDSVKDYLGATGNHEIPYIYMGETGQTFSKATTYSAAKISGRTWNTSFAVNAYDVLKKDGYDVSYSISNYKLSLTATKKFEDQSRITLKIANSYGTVDMSIYLDQAYEIPEGMTSWSDKIQRKMKKCIDGYTIPFFYIGTDSPKISERDDGFDLTGTLFDEKVFQEARNAFEKEGGWEFFYDYGVVYANETKKLHCSKKIGTDRILTVIIYGTVNRTTIVSCYLNTL